MGLGISFYSNHIATRPKTLPSIVSLFTGLHPNETQVRQNNQPVKDPNQLQRLVETTGINQNLKFAIVRQDQKLELNIKTAQMR